MKKVFAIAAAVLFFAISQKVVAQTSDQEESTLSIMDRALKDLDKSINQFNQNMDNFYKQEYGQEQNNVRNSATYSKPQYNQNNSDAPYRNPNGSLQLTPYSGSSNNYNSGDRRTAPAGR